MDLTKTTDATKWADDWLTTVYANPKIPLDRSTMITWFSHALMVGYDHGRNAEEKRWITAGCKYPAEANNGQ